MSSHIEELRQHPWLKEALAFIALILLLLLVLELHDRISTAEAELASEQEASALFAGLDLTIPWGERLQQANSRLGQLQSMLWKAPTGGVAVARLQDRINTMARRYKLDDFRLQMGEPTALDGHDLQVVRGRLDFRFSPDDILPLINEIEQLQPRLFIRELDITSRPGSRSRIVIEAYLHTQESGGTL